MLTALALAACGDPDLTPTAEEDEGIRASVAAYQEALLDEDWEGICNELVEPAVVEEQGIEECSDALAAILGTNQELTATLAKAEIEEIEVTEGGLARVYLVGIPDFSRWIEVDGQWYIPGSDS